MRLLVISKALRCKIGIAAVNDSLVELPPEADVVCLVRLRRRGYLSGRLSLRFAFYRINRGRPFREKHARLPRVQVPVAGHVNGLFSRWLRVSRMTNPRLPLWS